MAKANAISVVWKPTDRKHEGAFYPRYSIVANDNAWYCDNYYIVTPADAIRAISRTTEISDKKKMQQVVKIVRKFNEMLVKLEGKQANAITVSFDTVAGKKYKPLNVIADEIEQQAYKNGRLQMDCLQIHRRRVLSHRFEWHIDFLVGAEVKPVLDLVYKYDLVPEFKQVNHNTKTKIVISDGEAKFVKVPCVSDRDASKVSQDPDGRGIKEFIPGSRVWGGTKHQSTEYVIAVTGSYDLEAEKPSAEHEEALRKALKVKKLNRKSDKHTKYGNRRAVGYIDIYNQFTNKHGEPIGSIDNIGEKPDLQKKMQEYLKTIK